MRKIKTFFLLTCSMFMSIAAVASDAAPFAGQTIDGKLYVEPGTIYVAPNGIFLNIEGNFVPIEGVCMDQLGVYAIGYDAMRMVTCARCGRRYNEDRYSERCPHTGEKV